MRSRGAIEFRAMGGTQAERADRFNVTVDYVSKLELGRRHPSKGLRERIHAAGGPAPEAWDEIVPVQRPFVPRDEEPTEAASPEATRQLADRLQKVAQSLLQEVEAPSEMGDPSRRIRDAEKVAGVIASLGRITGAAVLNERQILASPAWRHVEAVIVDALAPWPDALEAMATALEALRGGGP